MEHGWINETQGDTVIRVSQRLQVKRSKILDLPSETANQRHKLVQFIRPGPRQQRTEDNCTGPEHILLPFDRGVVLA